MDDTLICLPPAGQMKNYSDQNFVAQHIEINGSPIQSYKRISDSYLMQNNGSELIKNSFNSGNHSFFFNQNEDNDEWKKNFLHLSEEYQRKFAILIMIMQVCEQGLHEIIYRMNNYSGNESARIADQVANFVRGLKSSFCVEKQRIEEARIVAINRIMDPQITNIEKKSKLIGISATTAACYRISILYDKALLKLVENALLQLEASNITYEYVLMIFKPCATKEQSTTKRQYLENLRFQFQQQSLTKFCKFSNPITETLLQAAQIYGMYPSVEVKRQLADTCGLTLAQVTSWFSNRRNRMKNKTKNS
ncbi:MAG: hypothetical protein MHPSP_000902 [Paramarteilia canceri]